MPPLAGSPEPYAYKNRKLRQAPGPTLANPDGEYRKPQQYSQSGCHASHGRRSSDNRRSPAEPAIRVAPGSRWQVRVKRTSPAAGAVKTSSARFQSALQSQGEAAARSTPVRASNTLQRKPLAGGISDVRYSKPKP